MPRIRKKASSNRCARRIASIAISAVLLAGVAPVFAQGAPRIGTTNVLRASTFDTVVDYLMGIGLSRASAEPLAKRIVARDPDALKTGALLEQMSSRMQTVGVPRNRLTEILEEAAKRRLIDASPGGAADGLVGRAVIAELVGEKRASLLRAGSNAGLVARALLDGMGEMQLMGVEGRGYEEAINDILRGGLSGDAAKARVGVAVVEELAGREVAAALPRGADSYAVAVALLDAHAGMQLTGVEKGSALGREITQGIVRGGLTGAAAAQFVKVRLPAVTSAAKGGVSAGRVPSAKVPSAPVSSPTKTGDFGPPPTQATRGDAISSGIGAANSAARPPPAPPAAPPAAPPVAPPVAPPKAPPAGPGSVGSGSGSAPGPGAGPGGGGKAGGGGGGAGPGSGGGGGGAGPGNGGGGGGAGPGSGGGGGGGNKDDGTAGGDSGGGTGDTQSHDGEEIPIDISGDAGGFNMEEFPPGSEPPVSTTPRPPGMEKETGTGLGMSEATGGKLGGQEAKNAMRGIDLKAGGGGAAGPGARDATSSGVILTGEEQRNADTALGMAGSGGVTDPHEIDRGGMTVTDRDVKDIGLKGNGGAKGPTESTGIQPVQPVQSPLAGPGGGGPIVAPAKVPVSAVPAAAKVGEVVDQVRAGGN